MKIEFLASTSAFAASSVYWILAAFFLGAGEYGTMMQVQALLLLVVGLFSLRTYDLSFHLQKVYEFDARAAFRRMLALESALFALCAIALCVSMWLGFAGVRGLFGSSSEWLVIVCFCLVSATIFQGSTQALLRAAGADRRVAFSDAVSALAFGLAAGAMMLGWLSTPRTILAAWIAASATRPAMLLANCIVLKAPVTAPSVPRQPTVRALATFLGAGQATNVIKNNAISVEVLLLAQFVVPEAVGIYRLARSFNSFTTVLLNIIYQRAFRGVLSATTEAARRALARVIDRQSLKAWALTSLVAIAAAAVFAQFARGRGYEGVALDVALLSIATLPLVMQQALFATLAVEGRYLLVGAAYLASTAILAVACVLLGSGISVVAFIACLFVSGVARYLMLKLFAARTAKVKA